MKIPHAEDLPRPLRTLGRRLLGAKARHSLAAGLERVAHAQHYAHSEFRRSRRTLASLANRYEGQTCVILGNGPSLKGFDLRELGEAKTFCLNRGYLLWREQGRVPDFFVAVNDLVLEQFHDDIRSIACPLFLPWRHHRAFRDVERAIFLEMRWQRRFFGNVAWGLWPGATVTFAALQIAYHLGFRKVVLVGIDHHFANHGPANGEVVQAADDPNHFANNYFGRGVRWNYPDLELSEVAYRLAKTAFDADRRSVIDATQGGRLTVFPKMSLAEALASPVGSMIDTAGSR